MVYTIQGFLDKNRDVVQDQLFEYMRGSTVGFIKSVTKFQNMLDAERKTIQASKMRRVSTNDVSASGSAGTSKVKPTVGDAFRRQLAALVDVLDSTTPWYIRCIKPNSKKKPGLFEDELVMAQLLYSGLELFCSCMADALQACWTLCAFAARASPSTCPPSTLCPSTAPSRD